MAEAEREKSPGFSMSEKHAIYSACERLFNTIYGMQKRGFTLRALEIPQHDRLVIYVGERRSQSKPDFG